MTPSVINILISAERGAEMIAMELISAIADLGLTGDRYSLAQNRKGVGYQVTLIESESIQRYNQDYGQSFSASDMRRNLVTCDVRLNELVGKRFIVGTAVVLEGIEFCEPCALLAKRTHPSIVKGLLHCGGLRARIIFGGAISVGDSISLSKVDDK